MGDEGRGGAEPHTPAGGLSPCTPFVGASPQGIKCLVGYPCLGLAYPFGATPQAPREPLGAGTSLLMEMKLRKRGCSLPFDKLKGNGHTLRPYLLPHILFLFVAKELAWGFGA